jgi:hypothetical protein
MIPANYTLRLVDEDTGQRRAMRTTAHYRFTADDPGRARRFRVEARPRTGAALRVTAFTAVPTRGGIALSFTLSQGATVDVTVSTLSGQRLVTVAGGRPCVAGVNPIPWDGRDAAGRRVPPGTYLVYVTASGNDGETVQAVRTVRVN